MKTINALVIQNKKLLVVKKNDYWILPGGKLDEGESDYDCLVREISIEELPGTNLLVGNYYKTFEGRTPTSKKYLESKCYFCEVAGEIGEPSLEIVSKTFVSSIHFEGYGLSEVTKKIVRELFMEGLIK